MLKNFATLYQTLLTESDQSTTSIVLKSYLDQATDEDKSMALRLLKGYKLKPAFRRTELTQWISDFTHLPDWLIQECHTVSGDWAETYSLLIGNIHIQSSGLSLIHFITTLEQPRSSREELKEYIKSMWAILSPVELFLFHKLILGTFKGMKENGFLNIFLSQQYHLDLTLIACRLNSISIHAFPFSDLIDPLWSPEESLTRPYAFLKPTLYDQEIVQPLGETAQWYVEPFLSGQRIQLVRRKQAMHFWSMDFNLITDQYESLRKTFERLPFGIVLDGIIQTPNAPPDRLGKIEVKPDVVEPNRFIVLDVLEWDYKDIRHLSLEKRKEIATSLILRLDHPALNSIPYQPLHAWSDVTLETNQLGWVLKRIESGYHSDQGDWLRFKSKKKELYTVLMYAEVLPRQTQGYTCTFGIYNEQQTLVPIIKLSTEQLSEVIVNQLHYWIQNNIIQKFGPVRVVRPQQMFLIVFDQVIKNPRLKAGFTLKNAQIKKWESTPSIHHKIGSLELIKNLI